MPNFVRRPLFALLAAAALAGCRSVPAPPPPVPAAPPTAAAAQPARHAGSITILSINDVYRIEGVDQGKRGGLARLRTLREELERDHPDLLVLHAGDFLFPSFLSRTYDGRQMVDVMNLLDGAAGRDDPRMFVTFGNHEFDKGKLADAEMLDERLGESEFLWLDSDIHFADGPNGRPLVASPKLQPYALYRTLSGLTVGLFSLTVDSEKPAYVESFDDPEDAARRLTAELRRRGADAVVALTHLEVRQDMAILADLGAAGPDLVIGGHDHQHQAREVGGRWVLKGDADAVTAVVATLTVGDDGAVAVSHRFVELGPDEPPPDPQVEARVEEWLARHDARYCREKLDRAPGCLADPVGHTRVRLGAEELEIRRFETNLGDWIVDRVREAFPGERIDAAFINSGSLRLNQDIPAGATITRRTLEELFAYPAPLRLLEMDGRTLREVAARAVRGWTGNGWWLQVSGFAFHQDPAAETVSGLTLLTPDGPRTIADDDLLQVATSDYLAEGNDGYTMLPGSTRTLAEGPDLKQVVLDALTGAEPAGIAPRVEGRICNPERPGPCLAVSASD